MDLTKACLISRVQAVKIWVKVKGGLEIFYGGVGAAIRTAQFYMHLHKIRKKADLIYSFSLLF